MPDIWTIPITLPREAFSPRDALRAGSVWRALQEVAVKGSGKVGWPPERYWAIGSAFIVRHMSVRHHREASYGEAVHGRTWLSEFRRGLIVTREIDLIGEKGPLCSATQEWVHVSKAMRPERAPKELVDAFNVADDRDSVSLPAFDGPAGPEHTFAFDCWHTWMDPLGHANHPDYLFWCDEALSRAMVSAGLSPLALAPVTEHIKFRRGVTAGQRVIITTQRVGLTIDGNVVFKQHLVGQDGKAFADCVSVRRLVDGGTEALAQL